MPAPEPNSRPRWRHSAIDTSAALRIDDDLTAMHFEDLFVALRDDQLSKLAREEPLQSSDAP